MNSVFRQISLFYTSAQLLHDCIAADVIFLIRRISQGSVATRLRGGGIFKHEFVANLPRSPSLKKSSKSVNI